MLARSKSTDPTLFEFDLEAREATTEYLPGVRTKVWTYNGTVPGPLIDVNVGTKLVVHFKNSLPQATTIHWHGIRLPNAMDGATAVQDPVQPGSSFDYAFTFKDPGLYWFHPHHRSDEQTAKGMYGIIRVRGPSEPVVDYEHVIALDDVRLQADGSLPPDYSDYHKLTETMKLHGRSGPVIVVNGAANRPIDVVAGAIHRFRFLNSANLRFFNLTIPGQTWRIIGTDGSLFEKPYDSPNLVIGPAERWDALLIPNGAPGSELALQSDAFPRSEDDPQEAFAVTKLRLVGPVVGGRVLPETLRGVAAPRLVLPPEDALPIEFDFGIIGGAGDYRLPTDSHAHGDFVPALPGDPVFVINKKAGSDIPSLNLKVGDVRVFKISNVSHQMHLFHLHGFFFQIVSTDDQYDAKRNPFGLRPELMSQANRDTVVVREGYSVTVVARFDEPGTWMYHCHIPEHSERGMMAEIHVSP